MALFKFFFFLSDEKLSFEVPLVPANLTKAEPSRFNGLGQSWTSNQKDEDSMEVCCDKNEDEAT